MGRIIDIIDITPMMIRSPGTYRIFSCAVCGFRFGTACTPVKQSVKVWLFGYDHLVKDRCIACKGLWIYDPSDYTEIVHCFVEELV